MKKLLLSLLIIGTIALFMACGDTPTPDSPPTPPNDNSATTKEYTIKWFDENGGLLQSTTVEEGVVPTYNYSVTDTQEWDYTFDGWTTAPGENILTKIPAATEDASYYAKVSSVKQKYTVTFVSNGGSAVSPVTVDYGTVIEAPEKPKYDGFRFTGWCTDTALKNEVDWSAPITANATYYASWNVQIPIGDYLQTLLSEYFINPYSYIPESMQPSYSKNLINESDVISDYSSFVNVSDITAQGFGEQWNMVIGNINQSMTFFKILSVVETLASGSVVAFNNYLDKNPGDTATYNFKDGIYNVAIDFDGEILTYIIDYTDTLPIFGTQTLQIALSLDITSEKKVARVQVGDANALAYSVTDDNYEFAIKYLGIRRAYFSVSKDKNNNVNGHIYEFITVEGVELKSAADFYINDKYAVAVGNKADGMLGFDG